MKRLRLGAILHFIIAIGHLGCLFALDEAFDAYGIKEVMHNMVFGHVWMLYALTFCLALAFALAGFYALSASGDIRRFPLTRTAIIVIIVLYSLRALAGGWACLADFVFVLAVGYKLFPWLKLSDELWMMIGLVALVKIVNAISSYLVRQRIEFLHTIANKLTGFLLFIGMMTIGQSYFIAVAWIIACFALFAAIQEGHLIRSR